MAKKRKIETGLIVGIIAIAINVITVSIYIYQADIMKTQQHASVWPYVEWVSDYNQIEGYHLHMENNGVGPALIKEVSISYNDEEIEALDTLVARVLGTTDIPHLINELNSKKVLPAGERHNFLIIKNFKWSEQFYYILYQNKLKMSICYESIYGDQWVSIGTDVESGNCK